MNKENMLKAVEVLKNIPQEMFSMEFLRLNDYTSQKCDSIGCALGHLTILEEGNLPRIDTNILFWEWGRKFFDTQGNYQEDYLFSSFWSERDNTPIGTAKRFKWVVENGFPSESEINGQLYHGYSLPYQNIEL